MHFKSSLLTVLLVASLLAGAVPLAAAEKGRFLSLDGAVSQVRKQSGGRVLSAETRDQDGRPVHHIRILSNRGKVLRYRVDAHSGRQVKRR